MPLKPEPNYFSAQVSDARRFYLDLRLGSSRQFTVASGGWEQCRSDYEIERPGFFNQIIEFVARGEGTLTLQEKHYDLKPGSVFVYGGGIPHRIQTSQGHAMRKYFVVFSGGAEMLRECQILPGTVLHTMHPDQIQQIFDDLIQHGLSDHANRARRCQIALQYLVIKLADVAFPFDPAGTSEAAGASTTYRRCRQFIEENFLQVHSLNEVADACHLDAAYLCRLFKRFRRQTPYQYLQNLKMNRAVELLHTGASSVKQVSQDLGFSDPYNFSRAFKRIYGMAPGRLLGGELNATPGGPQFSPAPSANEVAGLQ